MLFYVTVALLIALIAYLIRKPIWEYLTFPDIPSPPVTSWLLGHVPKVVSLIHLDYRRWALEVGTPTYVRFLWKRIVLLSNPEDIKKVLVDSNEPKDPDIYQPFAPLLGPKSLFIVNGEEWQRQRKQVTPGMSQLSLKNMYPYILPHVDALVHRLRTRYVQPALPAPVDDILCATTLNIIIEIAFGKRLGTDLDDADSVQLTDTEEHEILSALSRVFYKIEKSIQRPVFFDSEYKADIARLRTFASECINHRRKALIENNEDAWQRKDILNALLIQEDGTVAPEDELTVGNSLLFLVAGSDTTAHTVAWALYCIAKHKDEAERVYKEIDAVFASDAADSHVTYSKLAELSCLERFLKEVMRYYPTAGMGSARELTKDTTLEGTTFRKGTIVACSPTIVHFNPNVWPEPERFDPDRFTEENSQERHPCAWIPFVAGRRDCVGKWLAMMESKLLLATLLRHFRFEMSAEQFEAVTEANEVTMKARNLFMTIRERSA